MKIETKKEENYLSFYLRFKIPIINKIFRTYSIIYNPPNTWVMGYSARCMDSRFILFMDYDSMPYNDLVEELRFIQNKYKTSDFIIFKLDRDDSWHVINLDKRSMLETYTILKDTSVDFAFTNSIKNLQTRAWVLRWGNKGKRKAPQYFATLNSKHNQNEQSNGHKLFLQKLGAPINEKGKWDKFQEIQIVKYDTANRTEVKEKELN